MAFNAENAATIGKAGFGFDPGRSLRKCGAESGFMSLSLPDGASEGQVEIAGFKSQIGAVMLNRGGLSFPGLIGERGLSHEEGGDRERTRLVLRNEFSLKVEAVAPTIIDWIRIRLRAVQRKAQLPEFFLVMLDPAEAALDVADGNAAGRKDAAINLGVLINDFPRAIPTYSC